MDNLKRNKLKAITKLQNDLWKITTPNNNGQMDKERIENAQQLIADYINSEPSFEANIVSSIDEECSSCSFWNAHKREGTCSQKVKLDMGKFDNQITLECYGCNVWEKRK